MTAVASISRSTVHEPDTLTDDALRDLFAYPDRLSRPRLRANFITSIDGAVTLEGAGRKLGTDTDRRVFKRLREVADVILVGSTTAASAPYADIQVAADAQPWRCSHGLSPALRLAVLSSRAVIPPHLLADAATPPIVFVSASAPNGARRSLASAGAIVREVATGQNLCSTIRKAFADLGLNRVLVEGGPTLFSGLVAVDEIDELCLTTSPMMVAGPARRIAATSEHVEIRMRRKDILLGSDGTVIVRWVRP
ncbi:dihydrofolate reductase family protein [Mycolicibacterium holsaticum]|uniref:dihydrofolate reductase family protein n=1 Tax=Mycolicibacterium holsaticum TaxID=152142 RepID=UPI001C7CBF97|nr:dihydrofolate reductase family protein [Mycolicibacterium holsaticum]MDA4108292.1 deaminase reductase [Mycolicibacterium holsaticum DSM 44478 = JCM 12374]QZA12939.1 dihydrofolate reductase family protein [Mycolicibacterium holsaticum DSM 44478 = JCM 12374]UNC09587.1 dihydrofolate reductase family protein [Mycolicibacterium holsaticum DSM 44478 = JCM 12374]